MLSTPTSVIAKRRQSHRRQNSTPTVHEAAYAPVLPATPRGPHSHRRGQSLDQTINQRRRQSVPDRSTNILAPIPQEQNSSTVSIQDHGQPNQQHFVQEAQEQMLSQPGSQHQQPQGPPTPIHQRRDSVQKQGPIMPRTPPSQPQQTPSPQQLKELEDHIKSVYGGAAVYINILPTPMPTPQKPKPLAPTEHLELAPMPSDIDDVSIDFKGDFVFEQPEDIGYESSYYSSEMISPGRTPSLSPRLRYLEKFSDDLIASSSSQTSSMQFHGLPASFENVPPLSPTRHHQQQHHEPTSPARPYSTSEEPRKEDPWANVFAACSNVAPLLEENMPISPQRAPYSPNKIALSPRALAIADLNIDASIEDTGVTEEQINQYIEGPDPTDHKYTCKWEGCKADRFGRKENIRAHIQTHLGDRQFKCNHCQKTFVRSHDLKRHAKIHSGDKPYKCDCGNGFARHDALTRHRQRGMCIGGFPGVQKRTTKRGRPRKHRPEMEDRIEKASRTRMALAAAPHKAASITGSSSSASSPRSTGTSPIDETLREIDEMIAHSQKQSNQPSPASVSFELASSPFPEATTSPSNVTDSFGSVAESDLFQIAAYNAQTPPLSPDASTHSTQDSASAPSNSEATKSPGQGPSPTFTSLAFSTPPHSPVVGNDSIFDLLETGAEKDFPWTSSMDSACLPATASDMNIFGERDDYFGSEMDIFGSDQTLQSMDLDPSFGSM